MGWVRIHPFIPNWPGGGPPPVFEINSGENGAAIVELAWDPQALLAPAGYPDPLRYFNSAIGLNTTISRASGGTMAIAVPPQQIALDANRATWTIPQALWDGYVQESLKAISSPPTSTFARNLYYRVTVTAPGAAQSDIWPPNHVLGGARVTVPPPNDSGVIDRAAASAAPHIGILAMSATPASRVVPDMAAITAAGGIPFLPRFWSDLLLVVWNNLPENDPSRLSLAGVFAHPAFTAMTVAERGMVLKLWMISSTVRPLFRDLLARQSIVGSGTTMPILKKVALRGGKTMLELLLDLLMIPIHPDLVALTRDQLVADVLHEILDPNGRVNQGGAGTCAPTSVQSMLINVNPAEYVRLMNGLLSTAARAELADGSAFTVPRGILQVSRYVGSSIPSTGLFARNYSELAFQGAAIKFGHGAAFPADTGTEASVQAMFAFVHGTGLWPGTLLKAIFNVNFTESPRAAIASPAMIPLQVANASGAQLALATKQPILLITWWGAPAPRTLTTAVAHGSHAVVGLRFDGGRLFIKNPQYAGTAPPPAATNGGNASDPPRRYEDVRSTLESFTPGDLQQWIISYYSPDTAIV